MDLGSFLLAALGAVVVFGLAALAKWSTSLLAIPVEVAVGDLQTVVSARGRLLVSEPSVISYTSGNAFGLPRVLNFSKGAAVDEVSEYRLADPGGKPLTGTVHAFIAGCLLLSREELGVTQVRPLRAKVVVAISDPDARAKVMQELCPTRFKAIGVHADIEEIETKVSPP